MKLGDCGVARPTPQRHCSPWYCSMRSVQYGECSEEYVCIATAMQAQHLQGSSHVPVGSVYNVVDDDPASRGEVVAFARQLLHPGTAQSDGEASRSGQQGPLRAGVPGSAPAGGEREPDAATARLAQAEALQPAAPPAAGPAPAGAAASNPGHESGSRHVPMRFVPARKLPGWHAICCTML